MKNSDWLDTKQLKNEFGIAESTQAKYRSNKTIPYSKVGGFIFYSRKKIYEWLEQHALDTNTNKGAMV